MKTTNEGKNHPLCPGDVATKFRCWIHVITSLGIYNVTPQCAPVPARARGRRAPCLHTGVVHIWLETPACAASSPASAWVQPSPQYVIGTDRATACSARSLPLGMSGMPSAFIRQEAVGWRHTAATACASLTQKFGSLQNRGKCFLVMWVDVNLFSMILKPLNKRSAFVYLFLLFASCT